MAEGEGFEPRYPFEYSGFEDRPFPGEPPYLVDLPITAKKFEFTAT